MPAISVALRSEQEGLVCAPCVYMLLALSGFRQLLKDGRRTCINDVRSSVCH